MEANSDRSPSRHRVLHVVQPVEAGVPIVVRQLVAHQVARGYDVAVACPPEGPLPQWLAEDGRTLLAWPAGREPNLATLSETAALRRLVRDWRPGIVHLHSSKAGLAGRLAVRGKIPTLYQPHAWSFLAASSKIRAATVAWERWAARWTHGIACVSAEERQLGIDAGIVAQWIDTPNGVDLKRFHPVDASERAAARRELGLGDRPVVLCVARLSRQKGQDVLLDAWTRAARRLDDRDAVLVLVGDGPDRAALEAVGAPDVIFAGDQPDVQPWYAAADLFVLPSRWEGASLSVREAMASGLPVIATDVAGNREIPEIGEHTIAGGDIDALRAALDDRMADAAGRQRDAATARRVAEQHFDLEVAMSAVDDAYTAMLA